MTLTKFWQCFLDLIKVKTMLSEKNSVVSLDAESPRSSNDCFRCGSVRCYCSACMFAFKCITQLFPRSLSLWGKSNNLNNKKYIHKLDSDNPRGGMVTFWWNRNINTWLEANKTTLILENHLSHIIKFPRSLSLWGKVKNLNNIKCIHNLDSDNPLSAHSIPCSHKVQQDLGSRIEIWQYKVGSR